MTALLVILGAPVLLVGLAVVTIALRTRCGGCPAHVRFAGLRASSPGPHRIRPPALPVR